MNLSDLIDTYGYLAIWIGTFLEGETILVLGGFAAHRGYLDLPWVILVAFLGSLSGDQLFFYIGRRHSQAFLSRLPSWKKKIKEADRVIERYRMPLILIFRFLYGLRSVLPFMFGMGSVPTRLFIVLNVIGASIWAVTLGFAGYLFGELMERVLGKVKQYELYFFAALAVGGLLLWARHIYKARRKKNNQGD